MATCARCELPTSGKSKYCAAHKAEARQKWLELVKGKAEARDSKKAGFQDLWDRACAAGAAAAVACKPIPMVVQEHANMLDDKSPVKQQWVVEGGVCGFAWVVVTPGTSAFAHWLKAEGHASKHYYGGMCVWAKPSTQSMAVKEAWCHAFAEVLKAAGIKCYTGSRMD